MTGLLALEDGTFVLFSPDRKIVDYARNLDDVLRLLARVRAYEIKEPEREAPITELNLEDLGL
jgi:hypothetical protein